MKILQVHNEYTYPGGEDAVAASEAAMLRSFGHTVIEYRRSNKELASLSFSKKIQFYLNEIFFSRSVYDKIRGIIDKERPDIVHFHNSFFMIGPAAYEACFDAGVPVIQTLHNYRFLCAVATFFRCGKVCEECLSQGRLRGIVHACWHKSKIATWVMTRVIREYERRGILKRITKFITLSEFSRGKFIQAGWDSGHIVVKPNFLEKDRGVREGRGTYVLYVGALQSYKGVGTLLKSWASRQWPVQLKIVGSGPLEKELRALNAPGVEWLGQKDQDDVASLMKGAICIVVPSECYENFPRAIIEAYACGVPVIASRLGAMVELVEDGVTGFLFESGDAQDLAGCIDRILMSKSEDKDMGQNARRLFEERYSASLNHEILSGVYEQAFL